MDHVKGEKLVKEKVHVLTMGCAKNVVDSERLLAQLKLNNVEITHRLEDATIAIINTCGFIDAAKEESIDAIMENVKRKGNGKLKKVYAMGCLTERYREELEREIPEVDRIFGSHELSSILTELGGDLKHELLGERELTGPPHSAYLKISEGCDNPCSFCAIPIMRGVHVSRPMDEILRETELLARKGAKEVVVIGQDTTYYGLDIRGRRLLPQLLESIADIPGIEWVRLMYAYPAKFPREVLDVISRHPHVCNYLDMPVQHASDEVLKSMRRGISRRVLMDLISEIRGRVPGIALRTTLIVGYPTETPKEFQELLTFVEEMIFDRLGVFTYSQEDGTGAYSLGDPVPAAEKERRRAEVMALQQEISTAKNERLLGTSQRVLVDREDGSHYIGRTEHDAPEIDNEVFVRTAHSLTPGTFRDVRIIDTLEYDLIATL